MIRIVYVVQGEGRNTVDVILCSPCLTELKRNLGKTVKGGKAQSDVCEWCGEATEPAKKEIGDA